MNQLRFKLRDRVVGREGYEFAGKVGTVVIKDALCYAIQFDEPVCHGHSLGNSGEYKEGCCRWARDFELDPSPYFVDGRVGDPVYDMAYGDGRIVDITLNLDRPLFVKFDSGSYYFTMAGSTQEGLNQTLFYSKPIFELPPPPKRKVKKVIEGWENIYKTSIGGLHPTKAAADTAARCLARLGEARFVRHEYEE